MSRFASLRGLAVALCHQDLAALTIRQLAMFLSIAGPARIEGELSVRTLSRALQVSKPVVTRATTTLEGLGLITRAPHAKDRRIVLFEPGPNADAHLARLGSVIALEALQAAE